MDKIICVGKNYLDHAKELGDAIPEKPVLFLKPPSVVKQAHSSNSILKLHFPQNRGSLHFECELAFKIDKNKKLSHMTVALDMTLRDQQAQLKKNGHPWEIGKVFADSIVLGPWVPIVDFRDYLHLHFQFFLNGNLKQEAQGSQMRMKPQECLEYASEYFPICEGDVIMTGTPAGVGPVVQNDTGRLKLSNVVDFSVHWS